MGEKGKAGSGAKKRPHRIAPIIELIIHTVGEESDPIKGPLFT